MPRNYPERWAHAEESAADDELVNPFPARSLRALTDFHDLIQSLQAEREESDLLDLIDSILDRTGYKNYLLDQSDRGEERLENINQQIRKQQESLVAPGGSEPGRILKDSRRPKSAFPSAAT